MTPKVLGAVLTLAIHVVGRFIEDLRSVESRALAVRARVLHAHEYRVGGLAAAWWHAVTADVTDDHCAAVSDGHLRPMVLTDLQALDEAKGLAQPAHGRAHIGIDEHRNRARAWDRPVAQHGAQLTHAGLRGLASDLARLTVGRRAAALDETR